MSLPIDFDTFDSDSCEFITNPEKATLDQKAILTEYPVDGNERNIRMFFMDRHLPKINYKTGL